MKDRVLWINTPSDVVDVSLDGFWTGNQLQELVTAVAEESSYDDLEEEEIDSDHEVGTILGVEGFEPFQVNEETSCNQLSNRLFYFQALEERDMVDVLYAYEDAFGEAPDADMLTVTEFLSRFLGKFEDIEDYIKETYGTNLPDGKNFYDMEEELLMGGSIAIGLYHGYTYVFANV